MTAAKQTYRPAMDPVVERPTTDLSPGAHSTLWDGRTVQRNPRSRFPVHRPLHRLFHRLTVVVAAPVHGLLEPSTVTSYGGGDMNWI